MKIAIGGSACNPPHLGHDTLLKSVLNNATYGFDKVFFIVNGTSTYKPDLIDADHRINMLNMLVPKNYYNLGLIIRYNCAYTENIPAYRHFKEYQFEYPDADIYWYTGTDVNIESWINSEKLDRSKFLFIDRPVTSISSSKIREMIKANDACWKNYVTWDQVTYIEKNGLYL